MDTPEPTATRTETPTEPPSATPTETQEPAGEAQPEATPAVPLVTPIRSTATGSPTPFPAVRLSEVLPAPRGVDWDRNGFPNAWDQWVELYNGNGKTVDISGWSLDTGRVRGRAYRFPRGTVLRPGAYLVLYRLRTNLALDEVYGQVRLLDAAGSLVDSVSYGVLAPDESVSRDAPGLWRADWPPSPGEPNLPPATATRTAPPIVFR
jgi:hypothetical protein